MKGKQLAILLAILVVVGGLGVVLLRGNLNSWTNTGTGAGGKILEFPVNDVSHVLVKSTAGEVNLVKAEGDWAVQERSNYPANFEKIGDFVRALWELRTVEEVKVGPSQMPRLE